jgi:hypothetical protein
VYYPFAYIFFIVEHTPSELLYYTDFQCKNKRYNNKRYNNKNYKIVIYSNIFNCNIVIILIVNLSN